MLNMNQTGCRMGGVAFAAGEDLSLKAGYLVKLNAGKDLVLPTTDQDFAQYLIVQGADQGYLCGAVPVTSAMNCRIKLVGSCNAGELLVANGDGRVKVFTAGSLARPVGLAEETGVDGQLVLVRPLAYGLTGPTGADGADGAVGPEGPAGPAGGGFALPTDSITGIPDNPADLVGAVIAFDYLNLWYGNVNHPVMSYQALAVVTGYAGGVYECVLLSPKGIVGYASVVPVGCVGGTVYIGATCGVADWQNNQLWLAVDGGTMHYASQYKILAVGGGKVLLVSL